MNTTEIDLIKTSWQSVLPIKTQAAELFYGRLFQLDPLLRPLFTGDMTEQGNKLMAMINTVVVNLDQLDTVVPAIQDLGKRHAAYGVKNADYAKVGEALIWTLQTGLGDKFTKQTKAAWLQAYAILSQTMINAT